MIIFIDDEKWTISAYFDHFNEKADEEADERYKCKHFFYPTEAWKYIEEHKDEIGLIILDLMLFYGEIRRRRRPGLHGGLVFLEEIRDDPQYNNIPILIYTLVSDVAIESKGFNLKEIKNVYYLPRDCSDKEFYTKVNELLNKKISSSR